MTRSGNSALGVRAKAVWDKIRPVTPWISLAIGMWSAFGVVRHYEQARRVAWLLAGIWLAFGAVAWLRERNARDASAPKWLAPVLFGLAWVAQSMSQEILFFVLPFWIRSTTWTSMNAPFTVLLVVLAGATVFDPVYQGRIAPRTKWLLLHKTLVAFAGLAFVVPVLMGAHTSRALALAGALAGFATGFTVRGRRRILAVPAFAIAGAIAASICRPWIAPVPLRIESGVITSGVKDKKPIDTLVQVEHGKELWAYTPVFAPSGMTDTLVHDWSGNGRKVASVRLGLLGGRKEGFRTWSSSRQAASKPGAVQVDVATSGGQLVGRLTIPVK
jgi:hypothetical protein